jgi:predicted nucleotide-binding protein (sugar kinase/HSP70/actin superfamily)
MLLPAMHGKTSLRGATQAALSIFDDIETQREPRPKIAIFGDLYARDNTVFNQDLVHSIEAAGGEVVTTPYHEYLRIISSAYFKRWQKDGMIKQLLVYRAMLGVVNIVERYLARSFPDTVSPPMRFSSESVEDDLEQFHMSLFHEGESYDNVLKVFHVLREHPDISLFVQASPAFCCPSLVTEAMKTEIEALTGVPLVSITYDGTGTPMNEIVVPYVDALRRM